MMINNRYAHLGNEGCPGFDWSLYEDGWNGKSLKANKKVKTNNKHEVVYCHENYAGELYGKYIGTNFNNAKDLKKGTLVPVTDLQVVNDDTILAVLGGGSNNVVVDLAKESKLFSKFSVDQQVMTKEMFIESIKHQPEFKTQLLSMNLTAKISTDTEKGSIWEGYQESLQKEMYEQIKVQNKAYYAEILETNGGGFMVEVAGTIKAFMPGSMAATNKINDYDSYIGKTVEVMVESFTPKYGFVVSRKKYLQKIRPMMLKPFIDNMEDAPDTVYTGYITGATQYGVYVELNECVTGMVHKTLASDELRQAMREGKIEAGTQIQVYGHRIDGTRLILSDVAPKEREAVIARREAEDEAEKSAHLAAKAAEKQLEESQKQEA